MYPKDLLLRRHRFIQEAAARAIREAAARVIREAASQQDGPAAVTRVQDMWTITATDTVTIGQVPMAEAITAEAITAEDTTDKR